MFFDIVFKIFEKDALQHPSFVLVVFLLLATTASILIYQPYVSSADFQEYAATTAADRDSLRNGLDCLKQDIARASLDGQIRSAEAEVWSLEREIATGNSTIRDRDRRDKLKSDINSMNRKINSMRDCGER